MHRLRHVARLLVLFTVTALLTSQILPAAIPRGWYLAGSKPSDYEAGVDPQVLHEGHPSAFLKAQKPNSEGFGTLMQDIRTDKFIGKRIRLTGLVKTDAVGGWAALWMRVDRGTETVAFDNMQDRPLKGTVDWRKCEIVLDVPSGATGIFFGVLLGGSGTVWLNNLKFEIVGPETPLSIKPPVLRPDSPVNLDFTD